MGTINNRKHEYDVTLAEGDHIQVYINSTLTEVDYLVKTGNIAIIKFRYSEQLNT